MWMIKGIGLGHTLSGTQYGCTHSFAPSNILKRPWCRIWREGHRRCQSRHTTDSSVFLCSQNSSVFFCSKPTPVFTLDSFVLRQPLSAWVSRPALLCLGHSSWSTFLMLGTLLMVHLSHVWNTPIGQLCRPTPAPAFTTWHVFIYDPINRVQQLCRPTPAPAIYYLTAAFTGPILSWVGHSVHQHICQNCVTLITSLSRLCSFLNITYLSNLCYSLNIIILLSKLCYPLDTSVKYITYLSKLCYPLSMFA